ncbi:hypothetical protein EBB07_12435 [Paenibacillaceae bacterium]|nr:hypothetical protein EBB07_12435 [Paenibacillaceae bacterium]
MNARKLVQTLLLIVLVFSVAGTSAKAQSSTDISIVLDGKTIPSDVSPYIVPKINLTMVPLRVISEGIGAVVGWSQSAQTVTIGRQGKAISMTVGQNYAFVNGERVQLDASVETKRGRTMVPIRFVSEQLGLNVNWNQSLRVVTLQTPGTVPETPNENGEQPGTGQPGPGNGNLPGNNSGNMRGAWVATVYNLDWPSSKSGGNAVKQQQEYIALLDKLQQSGINTVFVQVRPAGDAIYPSKLVPWSKYVTGPQGKAPDYDPLAFAIAETHKRGMEFHAWFNPFRANTDAVHPDKQHVVHQHPDWIVNSNNKLYINPGIPQARQHIIDTIMEVVDQYDVDGVHLDDYFYPSGGVFDDEQTFKVYNAKRILALDEWRRDNINEFVSMLGQAIEQSKPEVRYGISPFGVWRNNGVDPTGSATKAGVTAYDSMHADVRTWIRQGWVDYIIPQIYWSFDFPAARYDVLADWWANEVRGTGVDLYIGHAPYKLGTKDAGWHTSQEIIDQLVYNTKHAEITGDVFFSAKDLLSNPLGLADALKAYYSK